MRKPRPQEYELPPMVVRQPASGWLETLENEVIIVQSLHASNNAALRVQSKLTKESGEASGMRNEEAIGVESGSWRGRFDIRGRLVPGGAKRESISHGEAIHGASRRTRRVRELKVGSLISSRSNARIDLARSCHRSRLYVNLQRNWRMSHHMWLHHPFHFSRKAAQRLHG